MLNKYLNKHDFVKNVAKLTSGTVIAQGLLVIATPILTRIFSPDDFGVFALYFSLIGIISTLVTGKYELAILLPKDKKEAINILGLAILLSILISVFLFILFYLFQSRIIIFLGSKLLMNWLLLVPLAIFLQGFIFTFSYWNNRNKSFGRIAASKISRGVAIPSSSIALGLFGFKNFGLIIGHMIGQIIEVFTLVRKVNTKELYHLLSVKTMKEMAKRYKKFPLYTAPSNLLNSSSVQLPNILLARFFNESIVGFYSQAIRLLNLPMTALGTSIGQVFFQKASELKEKPKELSMLTEQTFLKLFYIGVIPMSLVLVYGDSIFSFVLGKEWIVAGEYSMLLSTWLLFVFIGSPISNLIAVLEKQKAGLIFNIIMISIRISSLFVGFWIFNNAQATILVFGITGAFLWLIFIIYLLRLAKVNTLKIIFKVLFIYCITLLSLYEIKLMIWS